MRRPQRNTIIRGRRRSRGTSHYRGEEQAESCEVGDLLRGSRKGSGVWKGAAACRLSGGREPVQVCVAGRRGSQKQPPPMMRAKGKRKKSLNVGSGGKRRERTTRPPTSSPHLAREGGDLGKFKTN